MDAGLFRSRDMEGVLQLGDDYLHIYAFSVEQFG